MEDDDIDLNFRNLNRHQVLMKYVDCLRRLRALADQTRQMGALQFDNYILLRYFQEQQSAEDFSNDSSTETSSSTTTSLYAMTTAAGNYGQQITYIKTELLHQLIERRRKILYCLFYLLIVFLCVSYKNEAATVVVRNIQSFIYPGMKMWRKMTLPIIKHFPGLTELYDESCLLMNPFFQVEDLNCDPCTNVHSVIDLSDGSAEIYNSSMQENENIIKTPPSENVPFVFKNKPNSIELNDLYNIYKSNSEIFQRDAYRVHSTSREITNLQDLFHHFNRTQYAHRRRYNAGAAKRTHNSLPRFEEREREIHNLWRCNRMLPARLLRRLFTRPDRLPSTGVSLERFVAIDTAHSPTYKLPDTECANVYVQQIAGARFIILRPTSECRHRCSTLSVRLTPSLVLSYNWWYWKPISTPDPMSETISISLIGSYC